MSSLNCLHKPCTVDIGLLLCESIYIYIYTYVLQYTYKWILAVQFGTHASDISVTHQESFFMVAAGVTEISHDFLAKVHSETQIVNISK